MHNARPLSAVSGQWTDPPTDLPNISNDEPFADLVRKLSFYFAEAIETPHTFEELRSTHAGRCLNPLIYYLSESVHHPAIVSALLALKGHFDGLDSDEDGEVNEARGYACEVAAWRFVTHLSERETIDYLLWELPPLGESGSIPADAESGLPSPNGHSRQASNENTPLLGRPGSHSFTSTFSRRSSRFATDQVVRGRHDIDERQEFESAFESLNALEIAAVSDAKKFLSQRVVQRIVNGIWRGEIVFWETLSVSSVKKAKIYNKRRADPFCRLRVPRYLKACEVLFFAMFLALYYAVLVEKNYGSVTAAEVLLYVFIAGFALDEFSEYRDAGQAFYTTGFWTLWDLAIVVVGAAFLSCRLIGLLRRSHDIVDASFDILALEALFLVPRICSLLSLNPYFGTLIPCLKEMTKDFIKFLSLVVILYLGFLTTFCLLARGVFSVREMSWILVKVFFGSSYLGFDVAQEISPYLGPPVMLVFVCMTNILLITSLISLLSNSLTKVIEHAREEYLFVYSVYVLEASTSNRLTYYLPPLNLVPFVLRPLRLFVSSGRLRSARIVLLKITHFPYVAAIWLYENGSEYCRERRAGRASLVSSMGGPESSALKRTGWRASLNSPRPLAPSSLVQASMEDSQPGRSPTHGSHRRRTRAGSPGSDDETALKSLILKLSSRVEELTSALAQQQQAPPAQEAAPMEEEEEEEEEEDAAEP